MSDTKTEQKSLIKEKLHGIPKIYYLNFDEQIERRNYLENDFNSS